MKDGVSIIICCYNSSLRIEKTLQYIANQKVNSINCEVILIDNASSDNTGDVAKLVWSEIQNSEINFHIIHEPSPGLSYARTRGVLAANFEYLIFCDDDNWLDENYIQTAFNLFKLNTDIAILGGAGVPEFEDALSVPVWFDKFYHGYAVGPIADKESYVNNVYGAAMAVRKSYFKKIVGIYPMLLDGRKQQRLTAGDDAEICLRMRLAGYKILFSPQLTFIHFLTIKRLNWNYLKKLHMGFARSHVILNLYERALNSDDDKLPPFYWLKKALYYWGIYFKYWPKHFSAYTKGEGTIEEIHHITWKNIALDYLKYNFKTIAIYNEITTLKS